MEQITHSSSNTVPCQLGRLNGTVRWSNCHNNSYHRSLSTPWSQLLGGENISGLQDENIWDDSLPTASHWLVGCRDWEGRRRAQLCSEYTASAQCPLSLDYNITDWHLDWTVNTYLSLITITLPQSSLLTQERSCWLCLQGTWTAWLDWHFNCLFSHWRKIQWPATTLNTVNTVWRLDNWREISNVNFRILELSPTVSK